MNITVVVWTTVMFVLFPACSGDNKNLAEAITERDSLPTMKTLGVTTLLSDSGIKADTAYYYEKKKLWELRSNVHIRNLQGDKFDTQLLFWDEAKEQIYSDKPIRIEQADKSIINGQYGFKSNQQLTEYEIYNSGGEFIVKDTTPADSTKVAASDSIKTDSVH